MKLGYHRLLDSIYKWYMHLIDVDYIGMYALGLWVAHTLRLTVSNLLQVQPRGGGLDVPIYAKRHILYLYAYCH